MSYLGRKGANFPLTSGDIPTGSVEGLDIAFLTGSATKNISGTLVANSCYLSQKFVLTGNLTVASTLALARISDDGTTTPFLTDDGTARTITGAGTLSLGTLVQ